MDATASHRFGDLPGPARGRAGPADALLGPLARAAIRSRVLDAVLRRRAADIVRKAGLDDALPSAGLLLDLGAGLGHLTEAVLDRAAARRCVMVDPVWSPPPPLARRLARGSNGSGAGRAGILHADGTCLPFAACSFDAGWCAFVLHHLPPAAQDATLAEAARVLRPGGAFVLIEDTPAGPATILADRRLNREGPDAPHHYRTPAEWRAALRAAGLLPVSETPFTAVFPRATIRRVQHRAFACLRA